MSHNQHSRWKIDTRIPIALIVALLTQFAGALIWAAQLDARVGGMERQTLGQLELQQRFAKLEERLDNVKQDTQATKQLLDKLTERLLGK